MGNPLSALEPPRSFESAETPETYTEYASFWRRFAAALLDSVILWAMSVVIGFGIGFALGFTTGGEWVTQPVANGIGLFIGILLGWVYYAAMESSPAQATPGKMALGILVTDLDGKRISFLNATGRHFSKIISGLLCMAGYLMAAFTHNRQALHDMMAGTLVRVRPGRESRSAIS